MLLMCYASCALVRRIWHSLHPSPNMLCAKIAASITAAPR